MMFFFFFNNSISDQESDDDDDNITVTVPPAHLQSRGASFRDRTHHRRMPQQSNVEMHGESFISKSASATANQESGRANTPTFDEMESRNEEHVSDNYNYRHHVHHQHKKQPPMHPNVQIEKSHHMDEMSSNAVQNYQTVRYIEHSMLLCTTIIPFIHRCSPAMRHKVCME